MLIELSKLNRIITSLLEQPQSKVPPSYTMNGVLGITIFNVKFDTCIDFESFVLDGENGIIWLNQSVDPPLAVVLVIGIHTYKFLPPPEWVIINSASAFAPLYEFKDGLYNLTFDTYKWPVNPDPTLLFPSKLLMSNYVFLFVIEHVDFP